MDIPNQTLPKNLTRSEFANTTYRQIVHRGVEPKDVVDPDFWQHVTGQMGRQQTGKLRVYDKIEVIAEDFSFYMELLVIATDVRGTWAQTMALRCVTPSSVAVPGVEAAPVREPTSDGPDSDGYRVEFAGPHKFRIVRGNDVLETHLPTKAAAYAKLAELKAEKVAA